MLLKTGAKIDLQRRKCGRWWIYAPTAGRKLLLRNIRDVLVTAV